MIHATPKMMPKISSSNLAAIQGSLNQGTTANMFKPKLRTTDNIMLLRAWSLKVSISYVSATNIQTKEFRIRSNCIWRSVSILYPASFPSKVHLHVKNQMTRRSRPSRRRTGVGFENFKGYYNGTHLLPNRLRLLICTFVHVKFKPEHIRKR